jgi:hypothetical protein
MRYIEKVIDQGCISALKRAETFKNVTRGNLLVNFDGFSISQHGCLRCDNFSYY